MSNYTELKRLAEAFPADLDWDSNTKPFFNGPSGESLGGGATGFYSVYGKPFRLEGEDYDYDGPTYVEACNADFAKFMVAAREGVLALIAEIDRITDLNHKQFGDAIRKNAEIDQLKEENKALRKKGAEWETVWSHHIEARKHWSKAIDENKSLITESERNQRMLLAAACDIGAIGKALKADMNADGDELLDMVIDLKAQNARMLKWLKDISRTSGDKGAVMGARQLLKEFAK